MTETLDVAIVGAGPAGSCAARALAAEGFSVAIFEKDVFPRRKVCGEFLSAAGLRQLRRWDLAGELERAGAESIYEMGFFLSSGRSRRFVLPDPGVGISRSRLDAILARHAETRGARLLFSHEVVGLDGDLARGFAIVARTPGGNRTFSARAVLAAWGRWSPLDLSFGREFASKKADRFFGWGQHLRGDSRHLAGRVHLYFFSGGYCGLSRVENETVNFAGVVSEAELRRAGGGWDRFTARLRDGHAALSEHLAPLSAEKEILGSQTVLFEKHSAFFRDILAAGDAAGVRDPFTGDGQASAISGGILAARHVSDFLRGRLSAAALPESYQAAWTRQLGPRFGWDALFRRVMLSPRLQRLALPLARPLAALGYAATRSRSAPAAP